MINEEGLRDWFGKSKSKDGKKGWVNVVTGDSCASDKPGEGVPKCVSSAKRASMSKKERVAAQAAKRREDPGQQSKSGAAKPTMVKTDRKTRKEEMDINEAKDKKGKSSGSKDACYHKVKSRYSVWPSAYASGALVKCRKVGAANWGNSTKKEGMEEFYALPELTEIQIGALKYAGYEVEVLDEKCWKGYEKKGMKTMFGKRYPNCVKKEEVEVKEGHKNPESVKGIAKELDKAVEMHKSQAKRLRKSGVSEGKADGDPCWDTHKQVGMKKKGGRMVPNCVPKNEEVKSERQRVLERLSNPSPQIEEDVLDEATRINENGNVYLVSFSWRAKFMMIKLFFPEVRKPTKQEVQAALDKVYPGCMVQRFDLAPRQPGEPMLVAGGGDRGKPGPDYNYVKPMGEEVETEGYAPGDIDQKVGAVTPIPKKERDAARDRLLAKAKAKREMLKKEGYDLKKFDEADLDEAAAWTKKSGKNEKGGLNEKGRKSYERENPGSDLKRPSKKVGNPRRASFCSRMKGMKRKLTSKKTASDPNSRINKSLRAWNC